MTDYDQFERDIKGMEFSMLGLKYPSTEFLIRSSQARPELPPGSVWCCDGGNGEVIPVLRVDGYQYQTNSGKVDTCYVDYDWMSPFKDRKGCHYPVYPYVDEDYVPEVMTHVMIDLETMGVDPTSAIIEIAAQFFDPLTGKLGGSFKQMVNLKSCTDVGMTIDPSTVIWWLKQAPEARERYANNDKEKHINTVLVDLRTFLQKHCPDKKKLFVWGNGKEMDCEILKNAFKVALGVDTPWDFRNTMDVRTVVTIGDLFGMKDYKKSETFCGVPHDPIDDAKHQIKYVTSYLQNMRKEPTNVQ